MALHDREDTFLIVGPERERGDSARSRAAQRARNRPLGGSGKVQRYLAKPRGSQFLNPRYLTAGDEAANTKPSFMSVIQNQIINQPMPQMLQLRGQQSLSLLFYCYSVAHFPDKNEQ